MLDTLLTDFFNWSLGWCSCSISIHSFHSFASWIVSLPHTQMMDAFTLLMRLYLIFFNVGQSSVSRIILEEINVVDGKKRVMV